MLSDVFQKENKGLKILLSNHYAVKVVEGCEHVTIAWVLGSNVLPVPTVHGLWHFTTSFSPLQSLYSKGTNQIYKNNSNTNKKANCGFPPIDKIKRMLKHGQQCYSHPPKQIHNSCETNEMLILSYSLLHSISSCSHFTCFG